MLVYFCDFNAFEGQEKYYLLLKMEKEDNMVSSVVISFLEEEELEVHMNFSEWVNYFFE